MVVLPNREALTGLHSGLGFGLLLSVTKALEHLNLMVSMSD